MTWTRLKSPGKDPRGTGHGDDPDTALARRWYGLDGKKWPRMILTIYPCLALRVQKPNSLPQERGFLIEHAYKDQADAWWESPSTSLRSIPLELYSDLLEMLAEAKAKLEAMP